MGELPAVGQEKTAFLNTAKALGTLVRFPAGGTIFKEGDEPDHMYVVVSGVVDLSSHGKLIDRIGAGGSLGIVGLMDGKKRTITAQVTEEAELALIEKRRFRYMVESVPNCVWYVMNELVDRLRATNAAL